MTHSDPKPLSDEEQFSDSEWQEMRAYVNGRKHALPKWIEIDPARHFRRMMMHLDAFRASGDVGEDKLFPSQSMEQHVARAKLWLDTYWSRDDELPDSVYINSLAHQFHEACRPADQIAYAQKLIDAQKRVPADKGTVVDGPAVTRDTLAFVISNALDNTLEQEAEYKIADAILSAGFRRVTADKGTVVEREELARWLCEELCEMNETCKWPDQTETTMNYWRKKAADLIAHLTAKPTPSTKEKG